MHVVRGSHFWQLGSITFLATQTTGEVILVAFWPNMASEAISDCLVLKIFLGEHAPNPPSLFTPQWQWPYQPKIGGSGPDLYRLSTL